MAFYIPSFVQKRILRYALSKFDIFDDDALHPDRLDIAWGKRSSFELRDIGLRRERLSELLQLPTRAVIRTAKIARLRLTIPADIHNSGIKFEVDGLHLDIFLDEAPTVHTTGSDKSESQSSSTTPSSPKNYPSSKDPSVESGSGIFDGEIPATEALARSYLAAEPPQEKRQLQEALEQSQSLERSLTSAYGSSGTEDGYGAPISLPMFVADFLEGVKNRAHAVIKDIRIEFGTTLRLSSSRGSPTTNAHRETVRIRLSLDEINVPQAQMQTSAESGEKENPPPITRSIRLTNARAALLSDPSLFEFLAHYSGPPSPVMTQRSSFKHTSSMSSRKLETQSPLPSPVATATSRGSLDLRRDLDESNLALSETKSESSSSLSDQPSGTHSISAMPPSQPTEKEETGQDRLTSSRVLLSDDGSPTDSESTRQMFYSGIQSSDTAELENSLHLSDQSDDAFHSQASSTSLPREFEEAHDGPDDFPFQPVQPSVMIGPDSDIFNSIYVDTDGRDDPLSSELMESRIFSHEEAASLYESAISTVDGVGNAAMPGGWGDESPITTRTADNGLSIPHVAASGPATDIMQVDHDMRSFVAEEVASLTKSNVTVPLPQKLANPDVVPRAAVATEAVEPKDASTAASSPLEQADRPSEQTGLLLKEFLFVDTLTFNVTENVRAHKPAQNTEATMLKSTLSTDASVAGFGLHESRDRLHSSHLDHDLVASLGLVVGKIEITADVSFVRLIIMALQQIHFPKADETESSNTLKKPQSRMTQVSIEKFAFMFVTVLEARPSASGNIKDDAFDSNATSEVLLELNLTAIAYCGSISEAHESHKLDIGSVSFGYSNEPIISFDSAVRMRTSVRDNLAPVGNDVKIRFTRMAGTPGEITMTTAPLCVKLDLTRLDELFTWFGGLSSVIELGNSMVSTIALPESKTRKGRKVGPGRGVRFKASNRDRSLSPAPQDQVSAKFTARIGGLSFVIIGSASAFSIDSTAIKVARRNEAVRVSIDRIRANGPYNSGLPNEVVPVVRLDLLSITYLPGPTDDDLDRVLALLSPSKDRDQGADEIILDTFLRQRRQGAILRVAATNLDGHVDDIAQLDHLTQLGEDLKKLSNVAKYLPDDDRPGLLILSRIDHTKLIIDPRRSIGVFALDLNCVEVANVTLPSLLLVGIGSYEFSLNDEELIGSLTSRPVVSQGEPLESPMLAARMIGDELEPTIKVTLWNARIEYRVKTILALQKAFEKAEKASGAGEASVATLQDLEPLRDAASIAASRSSVLTRPLKFQIALRETALGLNPTNSPAKALLLFNNADITGAFPDNKSTTESYTLAIKKMNILLIDDAANITQESLASEDTPTSVGASPDVAQIVQKMGFVSISDISAAKILIKTGTTLTGESCIELDVYDELLVLETCADSTQTLIAVFGGLSLPSPPSKDIKYRTQVVPMQDMLASFHGAEFVSEPLMPEDEELEYDEYEEYEDEDTVSVGGSFHDPDQALPVAKGQQARQERIDSMTESQLLDPGTNLRATGRPSAVNSVLMDESLVIDEEHFGSKLNDTSEKQRWNSSKNAFEMTNEPETPKHPFQLRVRDVHLIWNLFDGYDWDRTRNTISQAVANLEAKAAEAQAKKDRLKSLDEEEEENPVIEDFLFNSIYIGVGVHQTARDVAHGINRNIDDLISETASQTTGVTSPKSSSPSRFGSSRPRKQRLRLKRSRHHKMTFELKGICVDFTVQPPGLEETQSAVDVRVKDLDIFDHVPTSTWKKFATYMHDAGERESESNMVHIELLTVRPVQELDASEIVLRARVLPLRLHVDQDALDFLTRFFEFKAEPTEVDVVPQNPSEAPFIQRAEIAAVPLKLDFKPKRVDYAGLRSGRTTEFMNFIVLEGADMVLRRVIVYGICGFDRLGVTLNDIWMPDVRSHQLRGVLAGLAPVRPLVNVGAGVRDLVVVPVREYRKDGRVMRAVQKGAVAFAKTTTTELAKLGVKLAVGTQTALQSAETALVPVQKALGARAAGGEEQDGGLDDSMFEEEKPVFSPYADPPIGVVQGLRGAYRQLERDLLLARDAVVAMPGEIIESGSASGAAKAVLRGAPTVILRPALGVSKAVGQTLMGATASLDREQRRRIDDKYKRRG